MRKTREREESAFRMKGCSGGKRDGEGKWKERLGKAIIGGAVKRLESCLTGVVIVWCTCYGRVIFYSTLVSGRDACCRGDSVPHIKRCWEHLRNER